MTKARKVELLYQKAKGQATNGTPAEMAEIKHYKVESGESSFFVTKKLLTEYVGAVDAGSTRRSFYDWCIDNGKADRRRKGSDAKSMASEERSSSIGIMLIGWLVWGIAIYWIFNESIKVGGCAVLGAIVSFILYKVSRKNAGFTCFLLPIIIVAIKACL